MKFLLKFSLVVATTIFSSLLMAHGDVVPHSVDASSLPQLGADWRESNPYRNTAAYPQAIVVGASGFNQNCARCHGLEAISGGIAPDLRKVDLDCYDIKDEKKKQACFVEIDGYFVATVRAGRVRNGNVYMPPFEGILSQEAIWSIKSYIESRHDSLAKY